MKNLLFILLFCTTLPCLANGLFIHQEPSQAGHCFLADKDGTRLFSGEYQTDCHAIAVSHDGEQWHENHHHKDGYHSVHLLNFRGQKHAVINAQGEVMYHSYWFDNGPDYIEDGVYRIRDAKGRIGFADGNTGKIIIKPQFVCAFAFQDGIAEVANIGEVKRDSSGHETCVGEYFKINQQGKRIQE